MNNLSIEKQYQLYLQRVKLKESEMHPQQRIQLKQAFYGAAGQLLILFRDDLTELPEEDGVTAMQAMLDEVTEYWLKEGGRSN